MTRLVLLVLFGIVSMAYFPESREILVETAEPVITPALRWHTNHEMERVARELRLYQQENMGELPEARHFSYWLTRTLSFGGATDPWGGEYVLYRSRNGFAVVSFGPDGLPETEDDLRMEVTRDRNG